MRERPILFSGAMVRAILAGTKTQTRRAVKWRGVTSGLNLGFSGLGVEQTPAGFVLTSPSRTSIDWRCDPTPCPYGDPGDRLWVRETWSPNFGNDGGYLYRADYNGASGYHSACLKSGVWTHYTEQWRPSIHMPRAVSRITLEITGVRVERLQAISHTDAYAEGAPLVDEVTGREVLFAAAARNGSYRLGFRALWESINGPGSWDANPWVWVVEFKRVEAAK